MNDIEYIAMNNEIPEPEVCTKRSRSTLSLKEILRSRIMKQMRSLGLWQERLLAEIPGSWERYDNFVIFSDKHFKDGDWTKAGTQLWRTVADLFQVDNVAVKGRIAADSLRSPQVKVVYGESDVVRFKDNGIIYSWSVKCCMFCAGNVSERHRIAKLDCAGETVVDLFAGIGYFALPFLVKARCEHLHACEWNPRSVDSLKHNLAVNGVSNRCTIHEGDNRLVCPQNVADRVNLGLIPTSRISWKVACLALKSATGGVLHVHENLNSKQKDEICNCEDPTHVCRLLKCDTCSKLIDKLTMKSNTNFPTKLSFKLIFKSVAGDFLLEVTNKKLLWKKYEWLRWAVHTAHCFSSILVELYGKPWIVSVVNVHHVKSYAPHVDHMVLDLDCRPSPTHI